LQSDLHDGLTKWQHDWCIDSGSLEVSVRIQDKNEAEAEAETETYSIQHFLLTEDFDAWLVTVVFGSILHKLPNDELRSKIMASAKQNLLNVLSRLVYEGGNESASESSCYGRLRVEIGIRVAETKVLIFAELNETLKYLFPENRSKRAKQKNTIDAFSMAGECEIELCAELGKFKASDIATIQVGDVLMSNANLQLKINKSTTELNAHKIGRVKQNVGVKLR
jgi:hypothetical protein